MNAVHPWWETGLPLLNQTPINYMSHTLHHFRSWAIGWDEIRSFTFVVLFPHRANAAISLMYLLYHCPEKSSCTIVKCFPLTSWQQAIFQGPNSDKTTAASASTWVSFVAAAFIAAQVAAGYECLRSESLSYFDSGRIDEWDWVTGDGTIIVNFKWLNFLVCRYTKFCKRLKKNSLLPIWLWHDNLCKQEAEFPHLLASRSAFLNAKSHVFPLQ